MERTVILLCTVLLMGCHSTKKSTGIAESPFPLTIYKTKGDYYYLVPVQLNREGTEISQYPAPGDLLFKGNLALPTKLNDGYLLDNRGINIYTAFTSYTYEEYYALDKAPSKDELLNSIIDAHPFTEMYECGKRTGERNTVEGLNRLIKKDFKDCKDLLD